MGVAPFGSAAVSGGLGDARRGHTAVLPGRRLALSQPATPGRLVTTRAGRQRGERRCRRSAVCDSSMERPRRRDPDRQRLIGARHRARERLRVRDREQLHAHQQARPVPRSPKQTRQPAQNPQRTPLHAATRSRHTPQESPSLPPASSRPLLRSRADDNTRPSTGASGQNRGEKPWPPMGRNHGHQRGDSMAAYGEVLMATVTRRPPFALRRVSACFPVAALLLCRLSGYADSGRERWSFPCL
jgi:hypothetical protein